MTILQSTPQVHVLAGAALLLAIGGTPSAKAQDYPNQTVKIVVPFVAGGGVDVVARIVAPRLSEELGQPVIIENRGGAGGMLGAAAVAQSLPDGYTLLLGTGSTHGTNSSVYARLSYDPVRDFAPIALLSTSPLVLLANPSVTLRDHLGLPRRDGARTYCSRRLPVRSSRSGGRPLPHARNLGQLQSLRCTSECVN